MQTCLDHRWSTTSSHSTSDGLVLYQRCGCGRCRVVLLAVDGSPSGTLLAEVGA